MKKNILSCFVASAFDRNDVDNVYDNIIIKVLKDNSIRPLRVDKFEHNDDIDDTIFKLIEQSDFCIADLTYSRPSVYYEAGFAFGKGKQVIYTIRNDHFKPRIDDPAGILKVHFDLQMKNIISWSSANNAFRLKLERRIKKVIKPIILEIKKQAKKEEDYNAFKALSINNKQYLLTQIAIKFFYNNKYEFSENTDFDTKQRSFTCIKTKHNLNIDVRFYCANTITKKILQDFYFGLSIFPDRFTNSKPVIIHTIFVSFNSFVNTRLQEALPNYHFEHYKTFCSNINSRVNEKEIISYIHIVDNIKSKNEFKCLFQDLLKRNQLIKIGI